MKKLPRKFPTSTSRSKPFTASVGTTISSRSRAQQEWLSEVNNGRGNCCPFQQTPRQGTTNAFNDFLISLNPKQETGVLDFLDEYPNADGRGVVIAILDTGVDPGAEGLKQTSDCKVKVLERYDCSGAGDVDTTTIVHAASSAEITLLSGRKFKIPSTWDNPSGEYHIGFKPIYHLYPEELIERISQERRDKLWIPIHQKAIADAEKELEVFSKKFTGNETLESNELSIDLHMTHQEKFMQAEMTTRVEILLHINKSQYMEDNGPYLDCLVFKNSSDLWQTCLVPTDTNTLESAILLHEYNINHEYSPLSRSDQFNVSVNIWNDGNLLEIVGISDSHGTHVASIASAYFPEQPELNGVAPGAQIISCTIGDNRLDGQETGTAYQRAIARICRSCENSAKVHIINTSFGEATIWPPSGNLAEMFKEVVDTHGVIWISASGNDGPCLSSADSPAVLFENCIIGVAAYVSPAMMEAHAQTREKGIAGLTYTWCSRGPGLDGSLGINLCAPGGAITSVPNYTLMSCSHMNGSSMATPHATGCVALMLSLAQQSCIPFTPYSVKRALENTAEAPAIPEPFSQGFGLIQVPKAFELLQLFGNTNERFIRYKIECSGGVPGYNMQGIYIRDPPLAAPREFTIFVTPVFYQKDKIDPCLKVHFRQYLKLAVNVPWIEAPLFCEIHNETHMFKVKVKPFKCQPGIYYTRIDALDIDEPWKGPAFTIDVTVVVPLPVQYSCDSNPRVDFGTSLYKHGHIVRHFIQTPLGSTWGVLRLKPTRGKCQQKASFYEFSRFVVQTVTLVPGYNFKYQDQWQIVRLQNNEEFKLTFPVTEGRIVEIAIGRWWQEDNQGIDAINLTASVKFRGIRIPKQIGCSVFDEYARIDVQNLISSESIEPQAKLTHQIQLLKPNEMNLTTLTGQREEFLDKYIYQLQISFDFTVENCTEIKILCPALGKFLYESDYLSQLWMLFDKRKQLITCGDAFDEKWAYQISPGDYILKLQIRHENVNALYRFMIPGAHKHPAISKCKITKKYSCKNTGYPLLSVLLRMSLTSPIHLYCAATLYDCLQFIEVDEEGDEGKNCSEDFPLVLRKNEVATVFVRTNIDESQLKDLPSDTTSYLEGKFKISNHHAGHQYCWSTLKIHVPPHNDKELNFLIDDDSEIEGKTESSAKALHVNPVDLLVEVGKPEDHLKNITKIDVSIEYLILNKYYALAVKILLHRKKIHGNKWDQTFDAKLRTCFQALGWSHCVYFLDSNSIIQNPIQFAPF